MESTASVSVEQAAIPLRVAPRSLAAAFTRVPDPRRVASVAYPLAAVLALAVTAILANQLSELAIAQWGARQSAELLRALGFLDGRTPCQSTLERLFRKVDGQALAEALSAHFAPVAVPLPVAPGGGPGSPTRWGWAIGRCVPPARGAMRWRRVPMASRNATSWNAKRWGRDRSAAPIPRSRSVPSATKSPAGRWCGTRQARSRRIRQMRESIRSRSP